MKIIINMKLNSMKIIINMKLNNEHITLYDECYYNDNLSRDKWRTSIIKGFVDMYKRNVFEIIYKPNDFDVNKNLLD